MTFTDPGKISEEQAWQFLCDVIADLISSLPLRRVVLAWGQAAPEPGATISRSPRIVCCLAGRNVMWIPQGAQKVRATLVPGAVVYVAEEAWNQPLHLHTHTFLTIDFQPNHIRFYWSARQPGGRAGTRTCLRYHEGPPPLAVLHLSRALHELIPQSGECAAASCQALVESLLRTASSIYQGGMATEPTPARARWQRLCQYIEDHLHEPIRREDLAREAGVHPNHVSRLFRSQGEDAPAVYVQRRRLEQAALLLADYALPIKGVAARCGFTDVTYFHHSFRRQYGMSPGRYRLRCPTPEQ